MSKPKIAVLYAPGTNCHEETCYALELSQGDPEVIILNDLLDGKTSLKKYEGMVIPGGFSWGDHVGAGRIFAASIVKRSSHAFAEFSAKNKPIMGICNGDQVLMETGLLPNCQLGKRQVALVQNMSARFESRWVSLIPGPSVGFWTEGLEGIALRMPVAHGEGRIIGIGDNKITPAFYYADTAMQPTEAYPANPAGSVGGIAGVVDSTGMILGMMPHPERAILQTHGSTDGLKIFNNMIKMCKSS